MRKLVEFVVDKGFDGDGRRYGLKGELRSA